MYGVQLTPCLFLLYPSLAAQQAVFGLSEYVQNLNPTQHALLLAQLLPVVCGQILVVDRLASVHLDSWRQGLPCYIWDVQAFGVVLAAQRVEVQVSGGA